MESVEGEWSKFTVDLPANADDDCPADTEALSTGLQVSALRSLWKSSHPVGKSHSLNIGSGVGLAFG